MISYPSPPHTHEVCPHPPPQWGLSHPHLVLMSFVPVLMRYIHHPITHVWFLKNTVVLTDRYLNTYTVLVISKFDHNLKLTKASNWLSCLTIIAGFCCLVNVILSKKNNFQVFQNHCWFDWFTDSYKKITHIDTDYWSHICDWSPSVNCFTTVQLHNTALYVDKYC